MSSFGQSSRSGRHNVSVKERTRFVLDTRLLDEGDRAAACRCVLTAVAEDITTFETDIPWSAASEWPTDVSQAAELLSALKEPSSGEDQLYRRTGEVPRTNEDAWAAFITFAPFAYDASTWGRESQQITALADAGESVVAALTPEQAASVASAIGAKTLVPLKQWRKRKR